MKMFLFALLLVVCPVVWGQDSLLTARLDSLMGDALLERSQVGLMVYDLTDTAVVYARGERQLLRPASSMKVVTAVSALKTLGADYRFATRLYIKGEDAYVVGGMDPQLDADDLRAMADSLRLAVGDTLRGRLYADVEMVADGPLGWGWCWDDDEPPLTPLAYRSRDTFARHWVKALRQAGLTLADDSLRLRPLPSAGVRLVCERLRPVDDVLLPMLKESDNHSAESLFYALAAASGRRHATRRDAERHTVRLIRQMGLDPAPYTLADGSGLSLYNYVTPELLVGFLRMAWADSVVFSHVYKALPIAGRDGTLKSRLHGLDLRAKTGSVTGVSSLTGYLRRADGHTLAFAIINTGLVRCAEGRRFQDKICQELTK